MGSSSAGPIIRRRPSIAGEVVSAVSGLPWAAYVRSYILDRRELEVRPVGERGLTRETGRVREDVAQRDGGRVRVRRGRREPREIPAHLVVQAQLARVA